MYYPPTLSLGWIGPERFLVSIFLASEKFDSDLELDVWMHKTDVHPCLPKTHGYGWAWAPNVGLCIIPLVGYIKSSKFYILMTKIRLSNHICIANYTQIENC